MKTQKWCQDYFPGFWSKEVWPPSSPDLNLMNFCVWSLLEADACASSHVSVEALKSSLEKGWAKIPQETLHKAAEGFHGTLEHVIFDIELRAHSTMSVNLFILFYLYTYPPHSQESDGGADTYV